MRRLMYPLMPTPSQRLSQVSSARVTMVRLFQAIGHGQILDLHYRDGDPIFTPAPTLIRDVRLDMDDAERPELELADFALCEEVRRLMALLDNTVTGRLQKIEVRAGIPRRVLIEMGHQEVRS